MGCEPRTRRWLYVLRGRLTTSRWARSNQSFGAHALRLSLSGGELNATLSCPRCRDHGPILDMAEGRAAKFVALCSQGQTVFLAADVARTRRSVSVSSVTIFIKRIEVDPVSWTPDYLSSCSPRWRGSTHPMRAAAWSAARKAAFTPPCAQFYGRVAPACQRRSKACSCRDAGVVGPALASQVHSYSLFSW
jgi:hypothetical protein